MIQSSEYVAWYRIKYQSDNIFLSEWLDENNPLK